MKSTVVNALKAMTSDKLPGFALSRGHLVVTDGKALTKLKVDQGVDFGLKVWAWLELELAAKAGFRQFDGEKDDNPDVLHNAGISHLREVSDVTFPDYDSILPSDADYHYTTVTLDVSRMAKALTLAQRLKAEYFTLRTTGEKKQPWLLCFFASGEEIARTYIMPTLPPKP